MATNMPTKVRGVGTLSTLGGANFDYQNMVIVRTRFTLVARELLEGLYSPPSSHGSYTYESTLLGLPSSTAAQESFAQEVLMICTTSSSESSEHEEASSHKRPHEAESGTNVTALVQSPWESG